RPKGADCKSAGSAFPGSNPGAATLEAPSFGRGSSAVLEHEEARPLPSRSSSSLPRSQAAGLDRGSTLSIHGAYPQWHGVRDDRDAGEGEVLSGPSRVACQAGEQSSHVGEGSQGQQGASRGLREGGPGCPGGGRLGNRRPNDVHPSRG